ncbi:unnamed protein product [Cylicostephanus goldi]|uniref:Cystatin domain-containing protein n=1 Tax=Cylicostephanus goldi TaxID=71465 RepID=A0A3P6QZW2_CYLGO|nr:unnamed protein product [Cylicostephanus goldi]
MIVILSLLLLGLVADAANVTDTSSSEIAFELPTADIVQQDWDNATILTNLTDKLKSANNAVTNFQSDCSDPHNKEIACSVHVVGCAEQLFEPVAAGHEPPEAHDVRVEAFAKAMARQEGHQLHVDISWQRPPKNNSVLLRAFKLQVNGTEGDTCFVFNVTDSEWTQDSASIFFLKIHKSMGRIDGERIFTFYLYIIATLQWCKGGGRKELVLFSEVAQ